MQRSLRHQTIIRSVSGQAAAVAVDDLARLTGASAVTIRRDLAELEARGLLLRTRGGAARARKRGAPMPFSVRFEADQERKALIAAAAAGLIEDDDSVIIDNGTTCFAVAQALAGRPLTALALSLHAAGALAARPGPSVVVPGGPVATDSLAFVGDAALQAVREMRVDAVVLGACSASPEHGLTSTTFDDASLKRACLASANRRILVTTPDKLARTSTFRFGSFEDLTHLVTTADAPAEVLEAFREHAVEVVAVGGD
ncbi:DeoR/GlpR family DNA-binding transcription regulator [Zafaria sp. J156]|uniref:DeoR/GlpR family DNA-binding transcription regulator n=1 Tax=Zafaria sp. J156 TaxID=3116490 RepID=UPI002E77093D|nr:DeoR/GlpR family DNA-binding transcription regulator [Zafaria sp. J156]MEE1621687.1 DeoR/GlpR family DNA-binding transcription regulator [Zafaria sp. J156]